MLLQMMIRKIKRIRTPVLVCRHKRTVEEASMTLEAAVVLPLFLMASIILVSFMDAVKIQTKASLDLSNKARKLAMAGALAQPEGDVPWIDLCLPKTYTYPFSLPGIPKLRIAVRARVYPWVGSNGGIGSAGSDEASEGGVYYITDNQGVYHTDPNCTHMDLSIIRSNTSEIGGLRNAYGKKYRKCKGFPKGYKGDVYTTEKGDYYYPSTDYGSLTRHVHIVTGADHGGLPPCSRCVH